MEKEYNLLTKRLLAEGYTAENYPDFVKHAGAAWGQEALFWTMKETGIV